MKHLSAFGAILFSASTYADPLSISSGIVHEAHCGQANGAIEAYVSGGTPPYTYVWSPEPPNGQGTPQIYGLAPGDWTLTVTDAMAQQTSLTFTVVNNPDLLSSDYQYPAQDSHANCPGQCWGEFRVPESYLPGTPPYTYSEPVQGHDLLGEPFFYVPGGACGGTTYQIGITDNTGCSGTMMIVIAEPQFGSLPMAVTNILGSCTGGSGGSATVENVYDGNFFQAPQLSLYDMQDNTIAGQQGVGQTVVFNDLPPGQYYAKRDWNWSYQYTAFPCDMDATLPFDIPDLGTACGTVSGDVFIDNDQDCAQNGGEVGVPFQVLEILPGPQYAITDASGAFAFDIPDGDYTLGQSDGSLIQLCPVAVPVPFTIASGPFVIHLADSSTVPLDLTAQLEAGPMRPGFNGTFWASVRNLSPQLSGSVSVTMQLDNALIYIGATPVPTSVTGNTLLWELPAFTALQQEAFTVEVEVPAGTPIGTPLSTSLFVSNSLPEGGPAANLAELNAAVTGSFDPNVKTARTSSGISDSVYVLGEDHSIDYTIHFQNTGTDTAFTVMITDTLSEVLDMASFQQGVASHPFNVAFKPGRVVQWTFTNILLPDSGTNEVASHGLVSFRIRPALPLLPGTAIENTADIYFDLNAPVITAPSVLTAEFSTSVGDVIEGGLHVFPNPASDRLFVRIPGNTTMAGWISDAQGRTVRPLQRLTDGVSIDIGSLAPGAYALRSCSGDGHVLNVPFIKQR